MYKKNYFRPDYKKLYPDVEIGQDVLVFLKKSDRRIEYLERDLKRERTITTPDGEKIKLPAREVSLDWLLDVGWQFPADDVELEQIVCENADNNSVKQCLGLLTAEEQALLQALFFCGCTETEYARRIGRSQSAVSERKHKALRKMNKLMT